MVFRLMQRAAALMLALVVTGLPVSGAVCIVALCATDSTAAVHATSTASGDTTDCHSAGEPSAYAFAAAAGESCVQHLDAVGTWDTFRTVSRANSVPPATTVAVAMPVAAIAGPAWVGIAAMRLTGPPGGDAWSRPPFVLRI